MAKSTQFKHNMNASNTFRDKLADHGLRPDWNAGGYYVIADLELPQHCPSYTFVEVKQDELPDVNEYDLFDEFPRLKAWIEEGRRMRIKRFNESRAFDEKFFKDRDGAG